MLAGLLFATHDAADRPGQLTATLPFGGATVIEYQARLLAAAGATQIVALAPRLSPDLMGALARIARRGLAVDTVRSAAEASAKLHPLARVMAMADGLIVGDAIVDEMARTPGEMMLVVPEAPGSPFERMGGQLAWAGIARVDAHRIADVARLPRDYDPQSALLRVIAQAGVPRQAIDTAASEGGPDIVGDAASLAQRGRELIAASVAKRGSWVDRWLLAPLARLVLPPLVARATPVPVLAGGGALIGVAGLACLVKGWTFAGLLLALLASAALLLAATLQALRGAAPKLSWPAMGALAMAGAAAILVGWSLLMRTREPVGLSLAITLVAVAALGERTGERRELWWGSPLAYLLVLTIASAAGLTTTGLAAAAIYAGATLTAAMERLRNRSLASL